MKDRIPMAQMSRFDSFGLILLAAAALSYLHAFNL
jgi:hypothetical protein